LIEIEIERGEMPHYQFVQWVAPRSTCWFAYQAAGRQAFHTIATQLAKRKTHWVCLSAALHQRSVDIYIRSYTAGPASKLKSLPAFGRLICISAV